MSDCFDWIAEPANKITMITPAQQLSQFHNNHYHGYRSGFSSLLILEESIETLFLANNVPPFSPFYELFNRVMGELADGGLLTYWNDMDINPRGLKMKADIIGPQVLTMEHLMIGFQIYLIAIVLCVLTFGVEIGMKCVMNKKSLRVKTTEPSKCKSQKSRLKFNYSLKNNSEVKNN